MMEWSEWIDFMASFHYISYFRVCLRATCNTQTITLDNGLRPNVSSTC